VPPALINRLGGIRQLGMVVSDAEATARYMAGTLGVGPFFVLPKVRLENFRYRGEAGASPLLTIGLAQAGPLQIELIQQHDDTPSVYREFLDSGREGTQHLSVWFSESQAFDEAQAALAAAGLELVQTSGSVEKSRTAYYACDLPAACMIEISEGLKPTVNRLAHGAAEAARDWDGDEPIRYVGLPG
jgi:hypothetical protein